MSVRSTMNPRYLGIGAMVASAALGVTFAGSGAAYGAPNAPSSATATVAGNTLTITGTSGRDEISLAGSNDDPNALDVDLGNGSRQRFDRNTFTSISVSLGDGDDQFTEASGVFADEALTVDAGRGDDSIFAGDGNDLVFGGSGDDFVDGGKGRDTAFLDGGHDTFQWDPGEGSDVVDGGSSTDALVFNGAAGAETMSLSANGDQAVFLRDPGTVRMDMNDIEQLDLHALGGADTITINDTSGTGLRDANVDLGVAGAGDGAADVVTVNGDHRGHVSVEGDGSQVDVRGLKPQTHITGIEAGDQLLVNTP
jgi:hypothetical protein